MKKWHKRTLFVLALGVLGTVAVAYRPALIPDEVQEIKHFEQEIALPEHLSDSSFAFTHTIQLHNPQKGTWYAGGLQEVHKQLTPAEWPIEVRCEGGKLKVIVPPPALSAPLGHLKATWVVGIGDVSRVRRPNGRLNTEYQLHISCNLEHTPTLWRPKQREMFVQFITVDVEDKAADMGTALLAETVGPFFHQFRMSNTGPEAQLPARYCESALSNAMLRMLHTLAACTPDTHEQLTPRLINGAAQLSRFATDGPWPECWGQSDEMARTIAYRVGPVLEYLAEKECFGNQQLADFINGEHFARIFGESFVDAKSSDIQADLETLEIEYIEHTDSKN